MYLARQRMIKKQVQLNKSIIQSKTQSYQKTLLNKQSLRSRSPSKHPTIDHSPLLISLQSLDRLQILAHEQLSMQKVTSRQISYHHIQMFLLFSNEQRKKQFYKKLNQSLRQIFANDKTKKVFDEKWTHSLKSNVMGLFNRIVSDYYLSDSIKTQFNQLYYETIEKLMKEDKLSRIQEKFLDTFLSETMKYSLGLDVLGANYKNEIYRISSSLQKVLNTKETPKSLSTSHYLQYSVFFLLGFSLPHEKYLYNQLLHAPNPKYLYPFRKKGTFTSLTNQILVKSNKIDMIGFRYWSYYEYEESDIYQKVRKASEWQPKIIPLAIMLKKKVRKGLERYMNLIDEKVRYYSNRPFDEDGISLLNSYVQLCLQICYNHLNALENLGQSESLLFYGPRVNQGQDEVLSRQMSNLSKMYDRNSADLREPFVNDSNGRRPEPFTPKNNSQLAINSGDSFLSEDLSTVLQRVDIGTAFQSENISGRKQSKLKYFTAKLTQLYFILLTSCKKGHLRLKFITNFSSSIQKILITQNDKKFTQQITQLSLRYLTFLTYEERQLFIYSILERLNEEWENDQSIKINNEISKIDPQVLEYLSFVIQKFGLDDENDPTKKVLKLEFFYILAMNYSENSYIESKRRLSNCSLTINVNLSNNPIFDTLQIRKVTQQKFKNHLRQRFGNYTLEKKEHEGILAIIQEILAYRIQLSKDIPEWSDAPENNSFYSVLINFMEEAERLDPSKLLLNVVKNYFFQCKRAYFMSINQMKFKDETKKRARKLITQDVSYLVEASISSNPIIAEFSQDILFQYIQQISELAFYTRILIVFAECITILYKKASIEYESKAQILKGKNLTSSILIPTDNKVIIKRLTKIMIALYKIILKGHCIDDNYMRVKIGYLIKEYSKSTKTPFGWKYLKYLINNFKEDKEFIAKEILTNNSCSWFINEKYFSKKIREMKPEKLLLDKYLLPLHEGQCTSTQLKKLLTNIDLQQETEFLIVPAKGTEQQSFKEIIEDLQKCCQALQKLQLFPTTRNGNHSGASSKNMQQANSPQQQGRLRQQYYNEQTPSNTHQSKQEEQQNRLYDIISRIKMMYINKVTQIEIFSEIFQICKKYNNAELLKYILRKIVPFVYCINEFNERIMILISEMLFYVVNELNKATRFVYTELKGSLEKNDSHNIFDLLLNCFEGIDEYEVKEHSKHYEQLYFETISDAPGNFSNFANGAQSIKEEKSFKFMIIRFYHQRLFNLRKMFKELQKFLSQSMHVCICKGFSLSLIVQIFSINFILDDEVLQFLHLEAICYSLTSQLELVNVLKSSLEKGQISYEEKALVERFEQRTLKMGLNHFKRRHNYYKEELLNQTHNIKSLNTKIDFLIQICDYLRNQDFHELSKKKLPKRTDKIFAKNKKNHNLFNQIADEAGYSNKKQLNWKSHFQRASITSEHGEFLQIRGNPRQSDSNANENEFYDPGALRFTLLYLISEQIDKTKAYSFSELCSIENPYSLAEKKKFISSQMILSTYSQMGESDVLVFNMLKIFGHRIDNPEEIEKKLAQKITQVPDHGFAEFLQIFIESNKKNAKKIKEINFWKPPNIQILFKYLSKDYEQYPYLQQYVTKILSRLHSEQILFYLPQIVQSLTLKTGKIVYNFLLEYARNSASFAHQLIWIAKVQSKQQKDPHNKNPRLPGVQQNLKKLQTIAKKLIRDILRQFTKQQKVFFRQVNDFYQEVTAISGKMKPQDLKEVKKDKIRSQVQKIIIPQSAYLPINPIYKVVGIDRESGIPMQSAAKCPFLLTFRCQKYEGPDKDFENRKKYKKYLEYSEFENDFEDIKEEQQPYRIPVMSTITHGGRSPQNQFKYNSQNHYGNNNHNSHSNNYLPKSKVKFDTLSRSNNRYDELSLHDIRMDISDNSSREIKNNPAKISMTKSKAKINNVSKFYGDNPTSNNQVQDISCIFKVFDDIRQDCLALQVIQLFSQIFERHNLELKLFSYKTISNRTGDSLDIGGIIEVVPKTVSRDSIGKTNQQSLYQFFISNFGPDYNIRFQEARENFIRSQAAYSIISYILQIKDRHNGNILINTEEGYLIHIDFGFIFDISPANNLKFQKADFKLTDEMIKIMGGSLDSEPFQLYLNLVIKGFLICRRYSEHIVNIIKQMYHSGLPCFLPKSIENLRGRFVLEMSEIQAAEYMKNIVYKAADNWFTNWYDKIQWIQQKIYH